MSTTSDYVTTLTGECLKAQAVVARLKVFVEQVALDRDDRVSPGLKREASLLLQEIAEVDWLPPRPPQPWPNITFMPPISVKVELDPNQPHA